MTPLAARLAEEALAAGISPAAIEAFMARPEHSLAGTARALGMDVKTLRGHVLAGDIDCRFKGAGSLRQSRVFTLRDVIVFYLRRHRELLYIYQLLILILIG